MSAPWWAQVGGVAAKQAQQGSKFGALMLIVIGFFLAPMLVGIPIMIYGFMKLIE